jgi:hypothetical protein
MSMTRYECPTCETVFNAGDSTRCVQCGQPFAPNAADAPGADPLGPPPPYRQANAASQSPPPRGEWLPAPAAGDATPSDGVLGAPSIRDIGALGPPPPYRPIVQASPVFERGPAPDLEPWRLASLARLTVHPPPDAAPARESVDPAEDEWSLLREPDPAAGPAPPPVDDDRFERPADFGPRDMPMPWVPEPPASPMALVVRRILPGGGLRHGGHRAIRPTIWGAGIAVVMLVVAIAVRSGPERLMRAIPGGAEIYAWLGLAPTP